MSAAFFFSSSALSNRSMDCLEHFVYLSSCIKCKRKKYIEPIADNL